MRRKKRLTVEAEALFEKEAVLRASHLPRSKRTPTKSLAAETGLAYGYVANIISRKRREIEIVSQNDSGAANDLKFKPLCPVDEACSTDSESLIESVLADDRMRKLDPTSLPKVLRGRPPLKRPDTALISNLLSKWMKVRLASEGVEVSDDDALRYFRGEL